MLESGDDTSLIDISMGLQFKSRFRGRYEESGTKEQPV